MKENSLKASIILGIGLVVSSIIVGLAFCDTRSRIPAYISVKGLAEREVDANIGIWTIKFEAVNNVLEQVNKQSKKQTEVLVAFLKQQGFVDQEIIYGAPELRDLGKYEQKGFRYSIEMQVVVHSPKVSLMYATVQKSQELMKRGGALNVS